MPYRALLYTLTTLALAFLAIGMWLRAMTPMLAEVNAATQASPSHPAATYPAGSQHVEKPERQFKGIFKGALLLSFVMLCIVLTVGFFATLREWVRFTTTAPERRKKTKYVDAWKLAGERAQAAPEKPEEE